MRLDDNSSLSERIYHRGNTSERISNSKNRNITKIYIHLSTNTPTVGVTYNIRVQFNRGDSLIPYHEKNKWGSIAHPTGCLNILLPEKIFNQIVIITF